jgi:hypothetical protein
MIRAARLATFATCCRRGSGRQKLVVLRGGVAPAFARAVGIARVPLVRQPIAIIDGVAWFAVILRVVTSNRRVPTIFSVAYRARCSFELGRACAIMSAWAGAFIACRNGIHGIGTRPAAHSLTDGGRRSIFLNAGGPACAGCVSSCAARGVAIGACTSANNEVCRRGCNCSRTRRHCELDDVLAEGEVGRRFDAWVVLSRSASNQEFDVRRYWPLRA